MGALQGHRWGPNLALLLGLSLGLATGGCGLQIPGDVGTVVTDEKQFPGAGKPYPLPELGEVGLSDPRRESQPDLPTKIRRALEKR